MKLVLTCEHAVPDIPEDYLELFKAQPDILYTHQGYDPGAYDLFKHLTELADYNMFQSIGRLLVETNRSLKHPELFSRFTKGLSDKEKEMLLKEFYFPYRHKIKKVIQAYINSGEKVLHISVHSFTPVLQNQVRDCDIGLLYDPQRKEEKAFCKALKNAIEFQDSGIKIRFNYPYLGKADGFTTYLRRVFSENYLGIEIEVNQAQVIENKMNAEIKETIFNSLKELKEK